MDLRIYRIHRHPPDLDLAVHPLERQSPDSLHRYPRQVHR